MRTRGTGEPPASEAHRPTSAADPEMACLAGVRHAWLMVIEVTRIGGDGSICRAVVDTAGRDDAARWEGLAQQAALAVPPPYRTGPGRPVHQMSAGGPAAQGAEE